MTNHVICTSCVVWDCETGHILLQHRNKDPGRNLWVLPGGKLEDNEHPDDGLARELAEELGLTISSPHLSFTTVFHAADMDIDPAGPIINLYFAFNIDKGMERNMEPHKCSELRWFHYNDLPVFEMWKNDRWACERANRLLYLREKDESRYVWK
jgi:ADP-ribose pyrophosphatase YjhB (NUDIX family)